MQGTTVEIGPRAHHKWIAAAVVLAVVAAAAFAFGRSAGKATVTAPTTQPTQPPQPLVGVPSTTTSTATGRTTTTVVDKSGAAGGFAGDWYRHGVVFSLDPSGWGQIQFRTYKWCGLQGPPPCDFLGFDHVIRNGGFATFSLTADGAAHATGEVLTSTAPDLVPVGPVSASYDLGADVMTFSLTGHDPLVVCRPQSTSGECSA